MTPDAFGELRQFLLVRLVLGAGLLIVVGALALTWVPGAATVGPSRTLPPSSTGDRTPSAARPGASATSNGLSIDAARLAGDPRNPLDKPRLEEVMSSLAAPEPLEGKSLEILPKRTEVEAPSGTDRAPDEKTDTPAKLPKGPHLQAGIFAQPANAEEFRRRLIAAGYPAYIETRVHVGPYPGRKEAERAREKLKAEGTTTVYVPQ